MASKLVMKDLADLSYFMGIAAIQDNKGIFISQYTSVFELLDRANMSKCNPCFTLAHTQSKMDTMGSIVLRPYFVSQSGGWTSISHIYLSRLVICSARNMFIYV